MPGSNRVYVTSALNQTALPSNTEAAIQISPAMSVTQDGDPIAVTGTANITTGTGTTAVTVRCRRGTGVAGALVGVSIVHPQAASTQDEISFDFTDSPGAVAGQTYSITVQQTAGTGAGTFNSCVAEWTVGS